MNLALSIAKKYIFSFRSLHFITIISLISIMGIIVGVSSLISVLSIFNGFREFTEGKLIAFDPHIRILPEKGIKMSNSDSIIKILNSKYKFKSIGSTISGRIIGNYINNLQVMNAVGVDFKNNSNLEFIKNSIILGNFNIDSNYSVPNIVLGSGLSEKLRVLPNDTITISSPQRLQEAIKTLNDNSSFRVVVSGIFQSFNKEYDDNNCYMSNQDAQTLFNLNSGITYGIDIRIENVEKVDIFKTEISDFLGNKFHVLTWYDLHKDLLNILKLERIGTFIVLSLIIIIAVFNILASLTMTVIDKKRDISILLSIGSSSKLIKWIFLYQGMIIGLISSTIGTLLGLGFCYGQIYFKWFKMDTTKFLIDAIPITINYYDIILIFIMTLILSVLASYYPAKQAIKISLTDSIRFE